MSKPTRSPIWVKPPFEISRLQGKRVLAECRLLRRHHEERIGHISISARNVAGLVTIDLVMPDLLYPRPGHGTVTVSLTEQQALRIVEADGVSTDFVYEGVLFLNDDESEDTRAWDYITIALHSTPGVRSGRQLSRAADYRGWAKFYLL
jgi:hypothetical protein